jgi:hypothetical protein
MPAVLRYPTKLLIPFLKTVVKIAEFNNKTSLMGYWGTTRNHIAKARYGKTFDELSAEFAAEQAKPMRDAAKMHELETQMLDATETVKERMGRANLGTAAFLLGVLAAVAGRTVWTAPNDEKGRKLFYDSGMREHSIRIGNTYIPMVYLGPLMIPFAAGAALRSIWKDNPETAHKAWYAKLLKTAAYAPEMIVSQLPVTGIGDFFTALVKGDDRKLEKLASGFVNELTALSGALRWFAQLVDPTLRRRVTIDESIKSGIPFWSRSVKAVKNSEGLDVQRSVWDAFTPWTIGVEQPKKLEQYKAAIQVQHAREAGKALAPSSAPSSTSTSRRLTPSTHRND